MSDNPNPVVNGRIAVTEEDIKKMEELLQIHQAAQLKHSDASMRALEFLAPHAARVAGTKQAFLKQLDLLREKYRVPGDEEGEGGEDAVWELSKTDEAFVRRDRAELRTAIREERQAAEAKITEHMGDLAEQITDGDLPDAPSP